MEEQDQIVVSSRVYIDDNRYDITYKVASGPVAVSVEPFLAVALLPAMKEGKPLHVQGAVSPRLLAAIPRFQEIFHTWYPEYQQVPVEAQAKSPGDPAPQRGVGSFFTAGIDSFYTFLKHRDEITHLIFVHGFDIDVDDMDRRAYASKEMQRIASDFGASLVEVGTNLRRLLDHYGHYGRQFQGAALGSVALLLSARFHKIYIPASDPYSYLLPWGSHLLTDPLWSTEETELVHDGCEATRIEKLERIASCDPVPNSLHVCWKGHTGGNCGHCWKCLRTMVQLRAVGVLGRCSNFEQPLNLTKFTRVEVSLPLRHEFESVLAYVKRSGKDLELEKALQTCLNGRYYRGFWQMARKHGLLKVGRKFLAALPPWLRPFKSLMPPEDLMAPQ